MKNQTRQFEGAWEEIQQHGEDLAGRRVRVTVVEPATGSASVRRKTARTRLVERLLRRMTEGVDLGGHDARLGREEFYDRTRERF